jgi:hypothetical protein
MDDWMGVLTEKSDSDDPITVAAQWRTYTALSPNPNRSDESECSPESASLQCRGEGSEAPQEVKTLG